MFRLLYGFAKMAPVKMQLLCNFMFSCKIYFHLCKPSLLLQEIIGDLPIVSNNDRFLAKFHSGTLRIIDTMRLMPLFQ